MFWKALAGLGPFQLIGARVISSFVLLSVVLGVTHRWRNLSPLLRDRALLARVIVAAVCSPPTGPATSGPSSTTMCSGTALGYFIAPLGTVLIGVVVLR